MTTTARAGPVIVGGNIHDTAHLTGGSGRWGHTISLRVWTSDVWSCELPISVPPSQTVAGSGDYTSGDFATSAVGSYRWIAHYSGDAKKIGRASCRERV